MAGRILWIAAGSVLAAVVIVVVLLGWWPVGTESMVTAALAALALCYGAVRSIGRRLWERWQDRIAEHIDTSVLRMTSRFGAHYREFVLNSVRFVDLKGLTTIGLHTPEIDDVFVDVSLVRRAASQVEEGFLAQLPANVGERLSLTDLIEQPDPRILGVVGVPGCGKTTLLRYTARRVCQSTGRRTVPILLYLRDHASTIVDRPEVDLLELLRATLGRYAADEPAGWFEQRLEEGRCVVLLDGLDEVARRDDRRSVADWIERQIAQYPDNAYVITSRPRGYRRAPISGAEILQVRSFTHAQVVRFVHGWYLAVEARATGTEDEHTRRGARAAADDLLERLNALPALYDLTINPLLLTMIANVHRDRGALPGSRAGLYSEICQVMLWRRQEAKRLEVVLSGPKKEFLLRGLAFSMMRQQVRDLPWQEVIEEFDRMLSRMPEDITADDLLADIRDHGLLIERKNGLYAFAHHTFQEFLAAAHIRDKGLSHVLESAVDDPWWRETTVLYAAMADADSIVRACLDSGSVSALSLAFDCAEGGRELAPEFRRTLDELPASTLTPDADPELRRVMIRVLITRHCRHLVRAVDGGRVCHLPITERVYRLYEQETGDDTPRWGGSHDDDPVTDVSLADALKFIDWINDVTDGEPGYRLPTRGELDDPAVRRRLPTCSAWVTPEAGTGRSVLWTPARTKHPHAIDAKTIVEYLRADIDRAVEPLSRLLLLRSLVLLRFLGEARTGTKRRYIDYVQRMDRAFDRGAYRDDRDLVNLADALTDAQDAMERVADDLERTVRGLSTVGGAIPFDHRWALSRVADLRDARLLTEYEDELDEDRYALSRMLWRTLTGSGGGHPLSHVLDVGVPAARAAAEDTDHARVLEQVLGKALSEAVDKALTGGVPSGGAPARASAWDLRPVPWTDGLHGELLRIFGLSDIEDEFVVYPDTLRNGALNAQVAMSEEYPGSWGARAASAFADLAADALLWPSREPIGDELASVLRLSAFCLAAEAASYGAKNMRTTFLKIAAGVTFLQRRAADEGNITQTIVLAVA